MIPTIDGITTDQKDGGGLYIHVAYCRGKCIYCDFFSAGERIADWHRYVDALCSEFRHRINELAWPLRTIYIGGGTPSLMPEAEFLRLCSFLRPYMDDVAEFTLEVNPDDVSAQMLEVWKRGGVDRLSMGIQSFDDAFLKMMGRRHDSKGAMDAYRLARNHFSNISIDLMFGLPGQTLDAWRKDLRTTIELKPEHISAYSLMYEEGTALTLLRDQGKITEVSEETTELMFTMLIEEVKVGGYDHYEISNFALPGFRSRHNSSYWLQNPYIGLGPSAHSYDGISVRKANVADLKGYIEYWADDGCGYPRKEISETEHLSDEELIEEYILTRMRMKEGIPFIDFRKRFGDHAFVKLLERCRQLQKRGMVRLTDTGVSLTEQAVILSDNVILELSCL